jgi:RES domain
MSDGLASAHPGGLIYRLGRSPDPWAWPDWSFAATDGTFGNRWDDPVGSYRVLYACSQRLGAFVETLARFRPDLEVVAALTEIEGDEEAFPANVVPRRWLDGRLIGKAAAHGRFADVGDAQSLAALRHALASRAIHYGLSELDAAAIRLGAPRAFTQEVSRFVYEWRDDEGGFTGIGYRSRLGDQFFNWAIFEPVSEAESPLVDPGSDAIQPGDPDLSEALRLLGLKLAE